MKQWIEVLVLGLDEENNTLTPEECFGIGGYRQNPIWITLCNDTGGCSDGYRASESTWLDQVKRMNDETGNCFPIQLAKSALYYLINHEDITLIEEPDDEDPVCACGEFLSWCEECDRNYCPYCETCTCEDEDEDE